ncbi:MAG: hypothetical protein GY847_13330 [Proteobacteria bacterium]|nr:hypothetical protein [Pseudomonadota bacterium]
MIKQPRLGLWFAAILIVCFLLPLGCRPHLAPINNKFDVPMYSPPGITPALEENHSIIALGIGAKGWHITSEESGRIVAEYSAGEHTATVAVTYDQNKYSITRMDSSPSFKFDGISIHRRYNSWINHLDKSIQMQFYDQLKHVQKDIPGSTAEEPQPESNPNDASVADAAI